MYGCESWTIKKAECWRIDAFELWCWRWLLRVLQIARRLNQSILKEINPENSWKDWCWCWNSFTLATWCKEPTHWKRPWCWERLKTGGEGDNRGEDGRMASMTQSTWVWASSGRWWRIGKVCCSPWGLKKVRHDWATEQHFSLSAFKSFPVSLTFDILIIKFIQFIPIRFNLFGVLWPHGCRCSFLSPDLATFWSLLL